MFVYVFFLYHIYMYILHIDIYICGYIHAYVYIYIYPSMYIYIHTHVLIHTHSIHTHTSYIYMYIYNSCGGFLGIFKEGLLSATHRQNQGSLLAYLGAFLKNASYTGEAATGMGTQLEADPEHSTTHRNNGYFGRLWTNFC